MVRLIKITVLLTACMTILAGGYRFPSLSQSTPIDIRKLIPSEREIRDVQLDGKADYVKGEDLHLIIDGGAEIFHEYGFIQAIFQSYMYAGEHRINLEIYEMTDPPAAYGIYSFKTDTGGCSVEIGAGGWRSDYYMNFWKGSYLITIIGLDNSDETHEGILRIAHAVDRNIISKSGPPELLKRISTDELLPNGITYFKGLLALFNLYPFNRRDIFNFNEGLHAIYKYYTTILLSYNERQDADHAYNHALAYLGENDRFSIFKKGKNHPDILDDQGNQLFIKVYGQYIMIIISQQQLDIEKVFDAIERQIDAG